MNYPIFFQGNAKAQTGMKNTWSVESSGYQETCSVPPEFEGAGGAFSPEDFFLLALENCFIATFKVYAEYSKLNFTELTMESKLTVDKDESGKPMMSALHLSICLKKVSDEKKARLLVNKALDSGFILRSVKTTITHELNII